MQFRLIVSYILHTIIQALHVDVPNWGWLVYEWVIFFLQTRFIFMVHFQISSGPPYQNLTRWASCWPLITMHYGICKISQLGHHFMGTTFQRPLPSPSSNPKRGKMSDKGDYKFLPNGGPLPSERSCQIFVLHYHHFKSSLFTYSVKYDLILSLPG